MPAQIDPSSAAVLALNPGSSSLKGALRHPDLAFSVLVERLDSPDAQAIVTGADAEPRQRSFSGDLNAALVLLSEELTQRQLTPQVISHRVVHGGPRHWRPEVITPGLLDDLTNAVPLAPLHLPGNIAAMRAAGSVWPEAVQIACFDTGFHHELPEAARRLPIPARFDAEGVYRYGFHGLSVQSTLAAHPDLGGAVIAHLGSGCSVSAVQDGEPRFTSMSLTPGGGMLSATRTGDIDPGVVLYLLQRYDYDPAALRDVLVHESGIAGVSGGPHDLREIDPPANAEQQLALDMFINSAAMSVAGAALALDHWDSLVFTGGIGEHSAHVRSEICRKLMTIRGLASSEFPVDALQLDGVQVIISPADEELVLDHLARGVLRSQTPS